MEKPRFPQRLKDFFLRRSSNRDKQDARDNRSAPTPTLLEEATSSVVNISQNSPSLPERSSRTDLRPLRATESLASATPGRTPSPATHPITPHSHTTLPVSEDVPSLWSRAYEALRDEDAPLVMEYEVLLSKELDNHKSNTNAPQDMPQQSDGQDRHDNRIHTDPDKRHAQLKMMSDRGLRRADDKQTKYTIFGHQFVLRDQVDQAAQFVQALKGLVNEAVKASPEASLVWAGMCVLLPVFTNPSAAEEANRNGLSYVTSRLRYYVEFERLLWPESLIEPGLKTEFESHIVDLYQEILEFQVKTVLRFYRKWLANLGRDVIQHDEWDGLVTKIKEREQIVQEESNTLNNVASQKTLEAMSKAAQRQYDNMQSLLSVAKDHLAVSAEQLAELKLQTQILEGPIDLPIVHEARYDSADVQDSPRCEIGTRTRIQQTIYQWADDESGEPIFSLVGPAGTGKSTIARTVADYLARKERLAGGYFFKRGEQRRNSTTRLFPTLAAQLAEAIPPFKGCLWKSLAGLKRDAVEKKGLKAQFDQLLWRPLADLSLNPSRLTNVMIIDALDECERPNHLGQVLNLLAKLGTVSTIRLRVFVTSRSTLHIADAFRRICPRCLDLETEHQVETRTDVATFLKQRFASIKARWEIQETWPDERQLDRLIQLSTTPSPLFIYAATLCRFVDDPDKREDPVDQLDLWFHQSDSDTPQLDQIYRPILHYVLFGSYNTDEKPKPLAEESRTELFHLLGALVLVASPQPSKAIAALLGIPMRRVTTRLNHLRAVLSIPRNHDTPVTLLHKSFGDFLLSPKVSSRYDYGLDAAETHAMLAAKCIQRMKDGLKRDICDIQKPDLQRDEIDKEVIDTHIPVDLQYACLYWVYHLQQSRGSLGDDVCKFLNEYFLHWLEVFSLLGKISDCAAAIKQLINICQDYNAPAELREFITDANNVVARFGSMIEQTPLQIYAALILFCPVTSKVRERFWNQRLPNLPRIHGVKSDWDALRQTLNGHTDSVSAVAFSPDGQVVASASGDNTVRLWDAATGAPRQTLEGHRSSVIAVAFSPDGQVVASASYDRTVRLWDTATGAPRLMLKGHWYSVIAVAFSPDGQVVASASRDRTVRLWDTATGAPRQTLNGHTDSVWAVAFSPDGQVVASASRDNTVWLWDAATGAPRQTLNGHTDSVWAVAFSPDGQVVASASHDNTVWLWDTATGAPRQTLKGHTDSVWAVAFSPDGQAVASASRDNTVRLWDAATGAPWQTLNGHTDSVCAVAFSPDGQVVVSASHDKTVRLWDAATGAPRQTLNSVTLVSISAVAFSPDGQVAASASYDRTVRLWDAATGAPWQTLEGHTDCVIAVAFSPDGQVVASASGDNTVRLWDAATGAPQQTLEGHTDWVIAVAFSPDGQVVASASGDNTVRLWDAATGAPRQTLAGFTRNLTFDQCSRNRLLTDFGAVDLVTGSLPAEPYTRGETSSSSAMRGLGISPNRTWIMEGEKNIIWLPNEYRPTASAIRGSVMSIGCASGRVIHILAISQYP